MSPTQSTPSLSETRASTPSSSSIGRLDFEKENLPNLGFHFANWEPSLLIVRMGGLPITDAPSSQASVPCMNLEIDIMTSRRVWPVVL